MSGCGGDDGATAEKPAGPPRLTKEQLTTKMGEICQEHSDYQADAVEKYEKKHGLPLSSRGTPKPGQMEKELVVVILPIVKDTIRDLEALRPSREQEATFKAFIGALEHGIEYSERDPSWINPGSEVEPFYKARELSWELGTALCGQA